MSAEPSSPGESWAAFGEVFPGLYEVGPRADDQACHVYFLLLSDPGTAIPGSPPAPPTLLQAWDDVDCAGWFLFTPSAIDDAAAPRVVAQGRNGGLPPLSPAYPYAFPCLVWIPDLTEWLLASPPSSANLQWILANPNGVPTGTPLAFPVATARLMTMWGSPVGRGSTLYPFGWPPDLALSVSRNLPISLATAADGTPVFAIEPVASDNRLIQVTYGALPPPPQHYLGGSNAWDVTIPLVGEAAGSFCFSVGLQPGPLAQRFGCGFIYTYGAAATPLYYPFLAPQYPFDSPATQDDFVAFDVRLNPALLASALTSRFALHLDPATWGGMTPQDVENAADLTCQYFFATNGAPITLAPWQAPGSPGSPTVPGSDGSLPPGFAFSVGPAQESPPAGPGYYLSPIGTFQVTTTGSAGTIEVMGGLFAQEFLRLAAGDVVAFVADRPAYAPGFSPSASPPPVALSPDAASSPLVDDYTTSWMCYPVVPTSEAVGYFTQPSASVYYATLGAQAFPEAVDAMVSDVPSTVEFPIVPYGGLSAWAPTYSPTMTTLASAAVYSGFELSVLTPFRHGAIVSGGAGPRFLAPGATTGSPALASAITPQGLLVELSPQGSPGQPPEGSWQRLILAQSPAGAGSPPSYLAFEGDASPGVVSPVLATALMQNELFLVVTEATALGRFSNEIDVAGFRFIFDIAPGGPGVTGTVLIFKFNTQYTLSELAAQPGLWANVETFVGDADQVTAAQNAITGAIQVGSANAGASGDPFGVFNDLVNDRDWTGVLALNLPIDGNGMPPDLQMLLGGINGQLTAHHFGVQGNRVSWTGGTPTLDSSLFGVIFYPGAAGSPPSASGGDLDYEVENLTVLISNSKIVLFNVTVGLTVNALFGRDVTLLAASPASPTGVPPNTLSIVGTYQNSGGVGTVIFSTTTPFTYPVTPVPNAARVIDHVEFDSATLVPFSSVYSATPQTTAVVARFTLGGQIWFAADPFPGSDGIDLFSYGTAQNGLAFSQFTVDVAFTLDAAGAMQPGSKTVTFRPELLVASATTQAIREGSLLYSLPLKLSNFVYAAAGLTPAATGATPVHCLQLQSTSGPSSPPTSRAAPYVTSAPSYALQFDLPLGSLGTLGDAHAGITASLLIGWGPSPVVPGSDAAAVMVQLPALSAGYQGFNLEGLLRTTFGDANLMKVDVGPSPAAPVYVLLFNNVQLSIFGYTFPPGVMIDFVVFAGASSGAATNTSNIAWFLAAQQPQVS